MKNIRTFIPGSEWLYFKIYTGVKTVDRILKQDLYPLTVGLLNLKIIDKWFFIRYADPDFHIRFRLHLSESRNFNSVFNIFHESFQKLIDNDLVWDIQCNTYQRELERYGSHSIDFIEDIFFIDSMSAVELLEHINPEKADEHRWEIALLLVADCLSAFSQEMPQRKDLINKISEVYKNEFGIKHHSLKRQLDEKYRKYRKTVQNIMEQKNFDNTEFDAYRKILTQRERAISTVAGKLIDMNNENKLQIPVDSLLISLIHMSMNRWFRAKNRLHELVVYDFMARYYTSALAINRQSHV